MCLNALAGHAYDSGPMEVGHANFGSCTVTQFRGACRSARHVRSDLTGQLRVCAVPKVQNGKGGRVNGDGPLDDAVSTAMPISLESWSGVQAAAAMNMMKAEQNLLPHS